MNRSSSRGGRRPPCGELSPVANGRAGRLDRVLSRIPERPLEFPARISTISATWGLISSRLTFAIMDRATSIPNMLRCNGRPSARFYDLRGALAYLRARDDHDPAGFGLFGVSRGGTTALIVAAGEPDVWGVVTDGAFPTQGTMVSYMLRWAEIYVPSRFSARVDSDVAVRVSGLARPSRDRAVAELPVPRRRVGGGAAAPRPWLMIHGQRDTYIGPEIARHLFDHGQDPKELWLVAGRQAQPLS